jgi:hypothetical protein
MRPQAGQHTDLADIGITTVQSGIPLPRMNSVIERWIQSCRHELLDRTLIWNQAHLLRALRECERHQPGSPDALLRRGPFRTVRARSHAYGPSKPRGRFGLLLLLRGACCCPDRMSCPGAVCVYQVCSLIA